VNAEAAAAVVTVVATEDQVAEDVKAETAVAVSEIFLVVAVKIKVAADAEKAEAVSAVKNGKSLNQIFLPAVPIFRGGFFLQLTCCYLLPGMRSDGTAREFSFLSIIRN